jgi:hypothetical protein
MTDTIPEFKSSHWEEESEFLVFVVTNDRERRDFSDILHHDVLIDGNQRHVVRVERFCRIPPYRKGESILLKVRKDAA